MNAFAFAFAADTTTGWMTSAAITLGIAIPTLVYALMRRRRPAASPSNR
jgi:hypothetical protein